MAQTDIWFPFYIPDYLRDTQHLNTEQHGAYVLLLFWFWSANGVVTYDADQFASITKSTPARWESKLRPALERLFHVENGVWTQKRVVRERARADSVRQVRSIAGQKGGRPPKQNESKPKPIGLANHEANPKPNETQPQPQPQPQGTAHAAQPDPEAARERHYPECNGYPTEAEAIGWGSRNGVAEWKMRDWWNEMESCGWKDHQNRAVVRWEALATRVKTKWEADGRPSGPPARAASGESHESAGVGTAEKILRGKELERVEAEMAKIREGYASHMSWEPEDRTKFASLRARKSELLAILGMKV